MPVSKVSTNYQVTIPKESRAKARIEKGDSVLVEFDEERGTVMMRPSTRGRRRTWKLGKRLTVREIERGIERGRSA